MIHYCPRCLKEWDCESGKCGIPREWICRDCQIRLDIHSGDPDGAD